MTIIPGDERDHHDVLLHLVHGPAERPANVPENWAAAESVGDGSAVWYDPQFVEVQRWDSAVGEDPERPWLEVVPGISDGPDARYTMYARRAVRP
jgi:hypothetical protein